MRRIILCGVFSVMVLFGFGCEEFDWVGVYCAESESDVCQPQNDWSDHEPEAAPLDSFEFFWSPGISYDQEFGLRYLSAEGLFDWVEEVSFTVRCYATPWNQIVFEQVTPRIAPADVQEFSWVVEYNPEEVDFCVITQERYGEDPGPVFIEGRPVDINDVFGEMYYGTQNGDVYDAVHGFPHHFVRQYFIDLSEGHQLAPNELPPFAEEDEQNP